LPISVTNDIPQEPSSQADSNNPNPAPAGPNGSRIACALLENPLQPYTEQIDSTHTPAVQPYLGGPVSTGGPNKGGSSNVAYSNRPSFSGVVLMFGFIVAAINL